MREGERRPKFMSPSEDSNEPRQILILAFSQVEGSTPAKKTQQGVKYDARGLLLLFRRLPRRCHLRLFSRFQADNAV